MTAPTPIRPIPPELQEVPHLAQAPKKNLSTMEKLERKSQPYIVISMAIVAAIRTMYIFTDKLVNLTKLGTVNDIISGVTGFLLAIISELTISIAGRRYKMYKAQLYQAEMAGAVAKKKDKDLWEVEIKRLKEQVQANRNMVITAMGMSLYAAASYLFDSVNSTGTKQAALIMQGLGLLSVVAIAGYVLYLMYFHGVQTDEIQEDSTGATAIAIADHLNVIRLQAMQRLSQDLAEKELDMGAQLALIASGLPITSQRLVMPVVKLLLGAGSADDGDDDRSHWLSTGDIAILLKGNLTGRSKDNAMRSIRAKLAKQARVNPDLIRDDPARGWIIDPELAEKLFALNIVDSTAQEQP